ncbi:MAG: PQQ-binding-like beta-propeller repeat protein [Planctomycetes bacterium]|nr:PQQ-binding-like beta-propeller repeat protein [Planctomycetota bacterium]
MARRLRRLTSWSAMRLCAVVLVFLLGMPDLPSGQDQDGPVFNEVPAKTIKRLDEAVRRPDWKTIFDAYDAAHERQTDRLARDPNDPRRLLGFAEWIRTRILSIPGAEEAFRERYEGAAAAAFREARDTQDWAALERAGDRYYLTSGAADALDTVAHRRFAEGDAASAAMTWQKLLRRLEPDDALCPVIACRLAAAYAMLDDAEGLARLREMRITGRVLIGGRTRTAEEYLASLKVEAAGPPALPEPGWSLRPETRGWPTNEIPLGVCSLRADGGGRITGAARFHGVCVRRDGREIAIATTGRRLVAFDPGRGDGKSLNAGVFWRWPEAAPIRGEAAVQVAYGAVFGMAAADDLLVGTVLSDAAPPSNPRHPAFDGAARVVAVEVSTGRERWDTAKLRAVHRGRTVPVLETLPFGDREFAFAAPPAIWGGRVYLPVATHPTAEREVHVLCLDAATGRPLWSRFVAAGPPAAIATFPALTVDLRGLFVATNLGALMALDPLTGEPRWAASYPTTVMSSRFRQPSPPALAGGRLHVLAQDAPEFLVFDAVAGKRLPLAWNNRTDRGKPDWGRISGVTEVRPGVLIATGEEFWLLNLAEMKWNGLSRPTGATAAIAHPVRAGPYLYVPYRKPTTEGIAVYETGSWRLVANWDWGAAANAEVCVGDETLLLQGHDVRAFASAAALERRFAPRVEADPPIASACLRLALIFREAGRWPQALRAYERFILAAEGDPQWAAEVREARRWVDEVRRKP